MVLLQIDENYVGTPPPREVTFVNLNDNINSDFLRSMVKDLGPIDECSVCYHPQNGKHLGVAKVSRTQPATSEMLNISFGILEDFSIFVDCVRINSGCQIMR